MVQHGVTTALSTEWSSMGAAMDVRFCLLSTVSITASPDRISRAVSCFKRLRQSVLLTAMIVIPASTWPCMTWFAMNGARRGGEAGSAAQWRRIR